MTVAIPWAPRLLLQGRTFRLPVRSASEPELQADAFTVVDRRHCRRDEAWLYYLRAPAESGQHILRARAGGAEARVVVEVQSLAQLRRPRRHNGVWWPRRWPLAAAWCSAKRRRTLQDDAPPGRVDAEGLRWWTGQSDATLWRQLPPAEFPRAHFVNVHQGCPRCGTAIFAHHGFYPWRRNHRPWDLRSACPACGAVFPSNDLAAGDFSGGDAVDDGFGYFDQDGHVFLFVASCHRELVGQYAGAIRTLTDALRVGGHDDALARQLGLLLLRWSAEEVYVAAAPQFRHGPSQEVETPWDWGQPDWASAPDPVAALYRKGSLAYAIDVPGVADAIALAYDAVWPLVRDDDELPRRARALGLELDGPADAVALIEECLACLLQCAIDGAALSNKPGTSLGALTALRALDRADAHDVLAWLYDRGPDRLRVFATNNFTPDGVPPEANGGYSDTHTRGLFQLESQLRRLRDLHPAAYPESRYPSLVDDPRLERIALAPHEMTVLGRGVFGFGDGGSSGAQTGLAGAAPRAPLDAATLTRAADLLDSEAVRRLRDGPFHPGTTVHDGVGIAILRTGERPERAAAGLVYGDASWHRHQDLLDAQLYAFDRPFLSDLGYPQSWGTVHTWEGHWATHNSVWSIVPDAHPLELPFDTPWHFLKQLAGRGRLVRLLQADGVQVVEAEARRWVFDPERLTWRDPGVRYRRLLALVDTDGDGVALVDLARVAGGAEHWRVCRGLEGDLALDGVATHPLPGTLAGEGVDRGGIGDVAHPDGAGLAWMDDVEAVDLTHGWRGTWTCRGQAGAWLDLHALCASPGAQLRTARATAVMGAPDESRYRYRALAWRRVPAAAADTTCIDLVFEPRIGAPSLLSARGLAAAGDDLAAGVALVTRAGRQLSLYWAPGAAPGATTRFADGAVLEGALAVLVDGRAVGAGAGRLEVAGTRYRFAAARQDGTIAGLDRRGCTIDATGLERVAAGDRIAVNPDGRGHTYRVDGVERLGPRRQRLRLDVSCVLGRARIGAVDGRSLELDFFIAARTAALHGTRLEREADGAWRAIAAAANRDAESTAVELAQPLPGAAVGQWVAVVAYVVGDAVRLEACRLGEREP